MSSGAESVLEAIRRLAAKELSFTGTLTPGSRLVEDLGLDSIRLLTLAVAVEDHFGVCLDERDEEALVTVEDLIQAVKRKLAGDA